MNRGYKKKQVREKNEKAFNINRDETLMKQNKNSADRIPLILTYNCTLPNMKDFLARNWNIDQGFQDIFNELPLLAYRKNKNPQDLLGRKNKLKEN